MTYLDALILGIVEGLTEFLPVSSTGHLILTNSLLKLDGAAADSFTIVIQLGAILAVLTLYEKRVMQMIQGLLGRNPLGLALLLKLFIAFIPAAIVGLTLDDYMEKHLFHPVPVASALVIGGILMIAVEQGLVKRRAERVGEEGLKTIDSMTYLDAVFIGIAQCFSLWPGTSRSMTTIVGAQIRGFSSRAAAEFSFLLALPTLGSATIYKMVKDREVILSIEGGVPLVLFGNAVAFIVAFAAVKWFVGFVTKHGMTPFGVYRIIIGMIFLAAAYFGFLHMPAPR